jgi:hypothetical protein
VTETIERLIAVLVELKLDWCLIGAHAVGEYTEPRATLDVDLLVDDRKMPRLLERLRVEFGELDEDDIGPAVRLRAIAVDLVRASSNRVFTAAIRDVRMVGAWRVPPLEILLVMKFMAGTSPFRGLDRRRQDMLDLVRLYRSIEPEMLDRARVDALAEMVFAGAAQELAELLARIDRDEPIEI